MDTLEIEFGSSKPTAMSSTSQVNSGIVDPTTLLLNGQVLSMRDGPLA